MHESNNIENLEAVLWIPCGALPGAVNEDRERTTFPAHTQDSLRQEADVACEFSNFLEAQDMSFNGFEQAIYELRAGRTRGRWMWFVFPQRQGVGRSWMSVRFALRDEAQATEYLNHPVLGRRYLDAVEAVHEHICLRGADPERVMRKDKNVARLRSSLALFAQAAAPLAVGDERFHTFLVQAAALVERLAAPASNEAQPSPPVDASSNHFDVPRLGTVEFPRVSRERLLQAGGLRVAATGVPTASQDRYLVLFADSTVGNGRLTTRRTDRRGVPTSRQRPHRTKPETMIDAKRGEIVAIAGP